MVDEAVRYAHLTAAGTAINRDVSAKLLRVTVNDPQAVTLTLYEGVTAGGNIIAAIDCSSTGSYEFGVTLSGLTADLSGTTDVTVVYQ